LKRHKIAEIKLDLGDDPWGSSQWEKVLAEMLKEDLERYPNVKILKIDVREKVIE